MSREIVPIGQLARRMPERIARRVVPDDNDCWLWTGDRNAYGYGRFRRDGVRIMAHRFMFETFVGPIPDGLQLDHLCRVRACCNPAHLEPVTVRENVLRGEGHSARNARKAACDNGHPFDEANTYVTPNGRRQCRQCRRATQIRYEQRSRS